MVNPAITFMVEKSFWLPLSGAELIMETVRLVTSAATALAGAVAFRRIMSLMARRSVRVPTQFINTQEILNYLRPALNLFTGFAFYCV